ncbi:MAG: FAD-dependent oxidoreductase [Flavobacteriaceae bacterium]|nr:FAD-dependent oxidoreductase [Flavobacteriaceae bacterium]
MQTSYWEEDTLYKSYDVSIVGAGFTGLWTALQIKEKYPDLKVVVCDSAHYPLGASTRNAGFACFGSISEILADVQSMGWDKTLQLIEKRFKGLEFIQNKLDPREFNFEITGGFELMKQEISDAEINLVNHKINKITSIPNTFECQNNIKEKFELGNWGSNQIIFNLLEGSLHPGKLVEILIRECYKLKINFIWNQKLLSWENEKNHLKLNFKNFSLESQKLLLCTNAFTPAVLDLAVTPARGQIILTSEIPNLRLNGVFHSDEGFIYFRNVGNRVLLGGMRNQDFETENTTEFASNLSILNQLKTYLQEIILPGKSFEITHHWSGIMAMGQDKSYLLGESEPEVYYAVRLSGMGVALAPEIAKEAINLMMK